MRLSPVYANWLVIIFFIVIFFLKMVKLTAPRVIIRLFTLLILKTQLFVSTLLLLLMLINCMLTGYIIADLHIYVRKLVMIRIYIFARIGEMLKLSWSL